MSTLQCPLPRSSRPFTRAALAVACLLTIVAVAACSRRSTATREADQHFTDARSYEYDLSQYCISGDLESVKGITRKSRDGFWADVNQPGVQGMPLNVAAEYGHTEIMTYLLSQGARIDGYDGWGRYPIHSAAEGGHLQTFQALEKAGADIRQKSTQPALIPTEVDRGFEPIHAAAKQGRLEIVRYLISKGVPADLKDERGDSPYGYASVEGRNPTYDQGKRCAAVMEYLASIGADVGTEYRPLAR